MSIKFLSIDAAPRGGIGTGRCAALASLASHPGQSRVCVGRDSGGDATGWEVGVAGSPGGRRPKSTFSANSRAAISWFAVPPGQSESITLRTLSWLRSTRPAAELLDGCAAGSAVAAFCLSPSVSFMVTPGIGHSPTGWSAALWGHKDHPWCPRSLNIRDGSWDRRSHAHRTGRT